jgi:phosphatidylserine decarboxylase
MVKDGYKFAFPPLVIGLFAFGIHWMVVGTVLVSVGLFVAYFFRDPDRQSPEDPDAIVSPADGRVMEVIQESRDGISGHRISVFLSIFNVHVNRVPFDGRISRIDYRTGKFYAAMRGRASAENEQNVIHLSTTRGEIIFKQIAGWVARRILCWKSVGDSVTRGERLGMIRFGSRVDIWLPPGIEIQVRPGQHVAGGSSILARWK